MANAPSASGSSTPQPGQATTIRVACFAASVDERFPAEHARHRYRLTDRWDSGATAEIVLPAGAMTIGRAYRLTIEHDSDGTGQ